MNDHYQPPAHPGLISDPDERVEYEFWLMATQAELSPEQRERMRENIIARVNELDQEDFDPDATQPAQPIDDEFGEESTALYPTIESVEREWQADFEQEDAYGWLSAVQNTPPQPRTPFVKDPFEGFGNFQLNEGETDHFRILTSKEKAEYRNFIRLIDEAKAERPELWQ